MLDVAAAYEAHSAELLRYLRSHLPREDAEDMCQQIFLRACETAHYEDRGQLRGWLYSIARSRLIDRARFERRHPIGRLGTWEIATEEPFAIEAQDAFRSLLTCGALTDAQRRVLWLRFGHGWMLEETAQHTGRTRMATKAMQHRAVGAIRGRVAP